jgi:hypothetical protein
LRSHKRHAISSSITFRLKHLRDVVANNPNSIAVAAPHRCEIPITG